MFLRHVARAYPDRNDGTELHLITDNYAAHKHTEGQGLAGGVTRASASTSPRPPAPG